MREEEDRREAAMAASPVLQNNFQSKVVTQEQLHKLQELRRRRLQIKKTGSRFNKTNDAKDADKTTAGEAIVEKDIIQKHQLESIAPGNLYLCIGNGNGCAVGQEQKGAFPWKKRQKLHWGLDTKERWERKGNM